MHRFLVVGGENSFVGKTIVDTLKSAGSEVFSVSRNPLADNKIDLKNRADISNVVDTIKPDVIIFVSFPLRDFCLNHPQDAISFVETDIKNMLEFLNGKNITFIFISSQDVFKNGVFTEEDIPDPFEGSLYAQLKKKAEDYIRELDLSMYYILRFGVAFGPNLKPHNFVYKMMAAHREGSVYYVYDDQFLSHVYTPELAKGINYLIHNNMPKGIYHFFNPFEQKESRYSVALKIKEYMGLNELVIKPKYGDEKIKKEIPFDLYLKTNRPELIECFSSMDEALKKLCRLLRKEN